MGIYGEANWWGWWVKCCVELKPGWIQVDRTQVLGIGSGVSSLDILMTSVPEKGMGGGCTNNMCVLAMEFN